MSCARLLFVPKPGQAKAHSPARRGAPAIRLPLAAAARRLSAGRGFAVVASGETLRPELKAAIDKFVQENKVVVFMKGVKTAPQCGFSNQVVTILNQVGVPFESVNILESDELRTGVKIYSNWPTFPQLYVGGEFFGGCDITVAAFQDGSLKEALEKEMAS